MKEKIIINPESIKPKLNGKSDFFSWQLYKWVKENQFLYEIWEGTYDNITGVNPENKVLYIGFMESVENKRAWFSGRILKNLCLINQKLNPFSYEHCHDIDNWKEITQEWWKEYRLKGVCAIHGDFSHKWIVSGNTRTCEYCKKTEYKTIEIVKKEVWV